MPEKFDLDKMLEEIKEDEESKDKKSRQVSQDEIKRILVNREKKK